MANFVEVPTGRVDPGTLRLLLEEFASRDGTDYGLQETSLEQRVEQLSGLLKLRELRLIYDVDSEQWDLLSATQARAVLAGESASAPDSDSDHPAASHTDQAAESEWDAD